MNKIFTCCFTGHRKLSEDVMGKIIKRLDQEVESLIHQGVTDFISGGALGFDQLAVSLIIAKKEMGRDIRLIFALPCKDPDAFWNRKQRRLHHNLLAEADKVIYVSEKYHDGCIERRNQYMIDHSSFCICALLPPFYETDQGAKYTREQGIKIINVAG